MTVTRWTTSCPRLASSIEYLRKAWNDFATHRRSLLATNRRRLRFGSGRCEGEVAWASEALEDRSLLTLEFHALALIYRDVELPNASGTLAQPAIDSIIEGVQLELPTLVNQLAGDQIQIRVHVEIVDRPLDQLQWDGSRYQYVTDAMIDPELDEYTKSGWYDHVWVFHGLTGDLGPSAWWGGGALARYGMTLASINIDPNTTKLHDHGVPGFLHEWMHGLEAQYFRTRRVSQGNAPDNSTLDLHDAEEFGYGPDTENRPGWSEFYGDFLTDHLRNFGAGGVDTGLGLGPDAWALGAPRGDVTFTPGSPLELPDASSTSTTFLSDMYWASAGSELGAVNRDATVDGHPIAINGVPYEKGVGIHADGQIRIDLRGRTERFQADVGVADDAPVGAGSVVFKIYGDHQLLFVSPLITGADAALHVDLDVVGVNQLLLEVTDAGDGNNGDHGVWANALFTPFSGAFISDVLWTMSSAGANTIQLDKTSLRNDIRINGATYGKGVGIHANGEIVIPLNGGYDSFHADVGINDDAGFGGSVIFEVYADGERVYSSPVLTSSDPGLPVIVDVTGVQQLRLLTLDAGNGNVSDRSVWAAAYLTPASKFRVVQSGGSTSVKETATTDTFTVVLAEQPTSNVVVSITSNDTTEATVSAATLTFTPANWNVPQTVTVTGVDDLLMDGLQTSMIIVSVVDESSDEAFRLLPAQTIAVKIADNDTLADISLSTSLIAEDLPSGSVIGSFSILEPEIGDTFTYTLVSGAGDTDNAAFLIDGDQLRTAATFNFEAKSSNVIRIRAVNQGVGLLEKIFTISVANVDEPPVITMSSQPLVYQISSRRIVAIDSSATMTDPDTASFGGAVLQVSGQVTKDQLSLLKQGGVERKGKQVLFNRTTIATFAGGKRGDPLTINLNATATQPAVQALLRAIGFKTVVKVTSTWTLQIQITNVGGKNSIPVTREIQSSP